MKIGFIGVSGHWRYALNESLNHTVIGCAAGFNEEDMASLIAAYVQENVTVPEMTADELFAMRPDVLVINTRFDLNAVYTLRALKENIFVFSEKPLAINEKDLEALENTATTAFVSAMFGITYEPWCLTMRENIGRIGEIRMINAQKSYKMLQRPDFYKHKETFGGLLPWVGIHAMHWISFVTGLRFTSVTAQANALCNNGHGDMETSAAALFTMENGALATLNADYYRPEAAKTHDDDRLRIAGTEGVIEYQRGRVTLINENGEQELPLLPGQDIFKLFLDRIEDGTSGISQEESVYITRVALAAERSAEDGERKAL